MAALRAKYREERQKRLRPAGHSQYEKVADDDQDFSTSDREAAPTPRDPVSADIDAAILGGGFAGLIAAVRMKQAGIKDVRIIEMGSDFGGTWYWNRYPGLQCDVESYVYLPLLEEVDYIPKKKYSDGPEIFEHCQRIGKHFGLYDGALFNTTIRGLRWDESIKRWRITTKQGDDIRARFVVMASGVLNKLKLPGIPGIRSFQGHSFHTARWDYKYTGGNNKGGLVGLSDKRVAIIGTGSTAIQVVPVVGEYAKHLYVFQRTPSYVDERGNKVTDPEWAKSLKPGWQDARRRNAAGTFAGFSPGQVDLICDGWSEISRNVAATLEAMGNPKLTAQQMGELRLEEEFKAMERIRVRVERIVKDKKTAEALKAWYRYQCKRPCFSDEYLPTFNRSNVTLVDVSKSKGVERITEKGLVVNGVEYEVDCIIYASGYEFTADSRRRYDLEVIEGRHGESLYDYWADRFHALHGVVSHGFPNMFFTGYTQVALGNVTAMYEQQAAHIAYIAKEAITRGAATVEPTLEGQEAWSQHMRSSATGGNVFTDSQFWQECTPGHYNAEGAEKFRSPFGELYAPGFYAFDKLLKEWRDKGDTEGLAFES